MEKIETYYASFLKERFSVTQVSLLYYNKFKLSYSVSLSTMCTHIHMESMYWKILPIVGENLFHCLLAFSIFPSVNDLLSSLDKHREKSSGDRTSFSCFRESFICYDHNGGKVLRNLLIFEWEAPREKIHSIFLLSYKAYEHKTDCLKKIFPMAK